MCVMGFYDNLERYCRKTARPLQLTKTGII
jgi:hypothetical protein